MELVEELFVTVFLAVILSLLVAKLVSIVMSTDNPPTKRAVSTKNAADFSDELLAEELQFREKLEVEEMTNEDVTEPVDERFEGRVEKFLAEELDNDAMIREFASKEEEEEEEREKASLDNFIITEEVKKEEEEEEEEEAVIEERKGEEEEEGERRVEIEDDWEGIERSELEKMFMEAVRVVGSGEVDEGVELELYGLHKVATEGPCREHPPLALKLSARAKCDGGHWLHCARNAWQRLGNMSPEVAMEQYVALVSDKVPRWMEDKINKEVALRSSEAADSSFLATDSCTVPSCASKVADNRNPELERGANKTDILTGDTSEQNMVTE